MNHDDLTGNFTYKSYKFTQTPGGGRHGPYDLFIDKAWRGDVWESTQAEGARVWVSRTGGIPAEEARKLSYWPSRDEACLSLLRSLKLPLHFEKLDPEQEAAVWQHFNP